jgi:hypothetical protein
VLYHALCASIVFMYNIGVMYHDDNFLECEHGIHCVLELCSNLIFLATEKLIGVMRTLE